MHNRQRFPRLHRGFHLEPESAVLAILVMLFFLVFVLLFWLATAQPALGQVIDRLRVEAGLSAVTVA